MEFYFMNISLLCVLNNMLLNNSCVLHTNSLLISPTSHHLLKSHSRSTMIHSTSNPKLQALFIRSLPLFLHSRVYRLLPQPCPVLSLCHCHWYSCQNTWKQRMLPWQPIIAKLLWWKIRCPSSSSNPQSNLK